MAANTAGLTSDYGHALLETGRFDAAAEILALAYDRYVAVYGEKSTKLIDPLMMQGHVWARPPPGLKNTYYDDAIKWRNAKTIACSLQRAERLFKRALLGLEAEHRLALTAHAFLVQIYIQEGEPDKIGPHCEVVGHLPPSDRFCNRSPINPS